MSAGCHGAHGAPSARRAVPLLTVLGGLLLLLLGGRPALADEALQVSQLPLAKPFDQPFFSLDGSHVELLSLLFLFMVAAAAMSVRRSRQLVRHAVQLLSLVVFFYVVFSCLGVFGMIRNTLHGISLIGTVYTESFFWMSLPVCVLSFTLFSGPFFCGWICPTGTIQEFVAIARERIARRAPRAPRATPTRLALLALLLAGFLYLVFQVSSERQLFVEDSSLYWAAASLLLPLLVLTGAASDTAARGLRGVSLGLILGSALLKVAITSPVHFAFVDVFDPASAITTLVLAAASLVIARAWCRYVCPWGMVLSLVHRKSRLQLRTDPAACDRCGRCVGACRVGAAEPGRVRTAHCQLCYACVDACPHGAIAVVDRWAPAAAPERD